MTEAISFSHGQPARSVLSLARGATWLAVTLPSEILPNKDVHFSK